MPGFEVSRKLEKLGWHASDTGELSFSDVRVPAENLLGEENKGFYLIMANFQWERLAMALGAVGGDAGHLRAHARVREGARGVRPPDRAASRRSATSSPRWRRKIEACRDLTYHGAAPVRLRPGRASRRSRSPSCSAAAPRSRSPTTPSRSTAATATCASTTSSARLRDARLGPIGGGTDEIMKEIIGKQLGL